MGVDGWMVWCSTVVDCQCHTHVTPALCMRDSHMCVFETSELKDEGVSEDDNVMK